MELWVPWKFGITTLGVVSIELKTLCDTKKVSHRHQNKNKKYHLQKVPGRGSTLCFFGTELVSLNIGGGGVKDLGGTGGGGAMDLGGTGKDGVKGLEGTRGGGSMSLGGGGGGGIVAVADWIDLIGGGINEVFLASRLLNEASDLIFWEFKSKKIHIRISDC